eukprot:Gb_04159 [translate_table: standard]
MQQGGEYVGSYYPIQMNHQPDLPNNPPPQASAPPYGHYSSSDSSSSFPYSSYGSNLNTIPNSNPNPSPTAPSYNPNPQYTPHQTYSLPSHSHAPGSFVQGIDSYLSQPVPLPSSTASPLAPDPSYAPTAIQPPLTVPFSSDHCPYPYDRSAGYGNPSAASSAPSYPPAYPPAYGSGGEWGFTSASSYAADLYEGPAKSASAGYDHAGYFEGSKGYDRSGYGQQQHGNEQGFYEKPAGNDRGYYEKNIGNDRGYDKSVFDVDENGFGGDVYAYDGGRAEPYGARGTSSKSWSGFDDYGRLRNESLSSLKESGNSKITRAVPKTETQQDGRNGVQKFRVKLLADSGAQSPMDVLCQIGLDGVRMLDPSTSRTLRIYPLETITRWEVTEPTIYTFWAKSPVDIEPRRIRLQSNSYTTNTILDTVAAATVQLNEMVGKDGPGSKSRGYSDLSKPSDQPTEKKKNPFSEWVTLVKPSAEEKQHWVPDEAVTKCTACRTDFGAFVRRHHCRNCGDIFCDKCTHGRIALTADEESQPVRVCDRCLAEVTQRMSNMKDTSSKIAVQQSHEDLAKKLQEEMEKNRKVISDSDRSSGSPHLWSKQSSSEGTGKRMREVACPTCTVHLQVQVPSSGSETVECGVCQHPFLVSAH